MRENHTSVLHSAHIQKKRGKPDTIKHTRFEDERKSQVLHSARIPHHELTAPYPTLLHQLSSDGNLCVTSFTVIIIILVIIEHSTKHEYRRQTKADRPECDRTTSR